jgi:hypothetical protein
MVNLEPVDIVFYSSHFKAAPCQFWNQSLQKISFARIGGTADAKKSSHHFLLSRLGDRNLKRLCAIPGEQDMPRPALLSWQGFYPVRWRQSIRLTDGGDFVILTFLYEDEVGLCARLFGERR